MITEQYVTFETARLLKEAGFDEVCRMAIYATGGFAVMHERNSMLSPGYVACPTQALVARWLREIHGLNISACFDYNSFGQAEKKWFYMREDTNLNDHDSVYCDLKGYASYEEAFEAGLKEALKLIIKNNDYEQ